MSEKRRASKGRILRTGEGQRKDGRYAYKYTDACGKTQFVYAWKLVPTDKTPTGKRDDISLREKVKEITTLRSPMKMLEYRVVPLMMSIAKIGEELSAAALTRGLGAPQKRTNICKIGFGPVDVFFFLLAIPCWVGFFIC